MCVCVCVCVCVGVCGCVWVCGCVCVCVVCVLCRIKKNYMLITFCFVLQAGKLPDESLDSFISGEAEGDTTERTEDNNSDNFKTAEECN